MANSAKSKLQKELSKKKPDFSVISDLTEEVLNENEDAVRFSVDAQHVQRLGFELVGKQETALSELIKNAYDADATVVTIDFENHDKQGGKLVISDNGVGMDADTIKKTWMRLSTDEKIKTPFSQIYKRKRAGKKGIGRFAVQRLGSQLILETEVKGESYGLRVHFDWDGDFTAGRDLGSIWNKVELYEKEKKAKGTKLIIEDLRDKWTDATIDRVWKSILLLQPPYKISKAKTANTDPGFSVEINGVSSDKQKKEASIKTSFLDHAIATITGTIDEDGKATFRVKSKKLNLDDKHIPEQQFLATGPVALESRYFIYLSDLMSGISVRAAEKMGHMYGGIRIYRDGFRVLPYGEPHDDWLNLAYDSSRRNTLVPANNFNFFGQVEINKDDNALLEETSGREGLIENEAYDELREFARQCIEWAATRVGSARNRKTTASQKGFTSEVRKPSEVIDQIIDDFEEDLGDDFEDREDADKAKQVFKAIRDATKEFEDKQETDTEERIRYEAMLRILASLGLSIAVFGHEVEGTSDAVTKSLALFKKELGKKNLDKEVLLEKSEAINSSVDRVFDLGRYISDLMSNTETRELKTVPVRSVIEDFVEQFSDYMSHQGIDFDVSIDPPGLRTCKMHRSELDSVLFNFLTNSIKALRKAKQKNRKIKLSAGDDGEFIFIQFEDNGCGVSDKHSDRIFDAFFTTSDIKSKNDITGTGTGLGLKIVSDIASSYGGETKLVKPSKGYNTCFEFSVLNSKAGKG